MDGRKRPAAPRSRSNSPPTQRRRQSEQSTTDRYANTAYSRVLPSPPFSRKNSAADPPAHTRTGFTSYSTNERHIDQNRRNNSRDVLHGPDGLQNGALQANPRRPSADHSQMHIMSPMSNCSGSNTPVQAAPIVPSMVPVTEKAVTNQSVPMDTLSALRCHKASRAANVAQTTDGSTTTEVRILKAQLRAAQIEDALLRSNLKKIESQLKHFEDVPAQLAALKDLVEQQQQAAARWPSPEDMETRIVSLENAKPAIATTQFMELQSDVQAMKTDLKKLDQAPEQLKQLQAMVTQHGNDIAEAFSKGDRLKTEVDDLASLKEEVKAIQEQQEQRQAMRGDAVRALIQAEIQPDIRKMEAFRSEHEKIFKDVSTKLEANQRTCDEVKKHNLPAQLNTLRDKISEVESNEVRTYDKVETLDANLTKLRKDHENLYQDINQYIGPINTAFAAAEDTIIQRIKRLEDMSLSLQKEQDHLSSEQDKLSNNTEKQPIDLEDLKDLQEIICGLGEEKEKLVKDVQEIKAITDKLQQHKSPADSAREVLTDFLSECKKLSERVAKLEAAPSRSASPAPSASHSQLKKVVEGLGESQKSLRAEHDTIINQIKVVENEQVSIRSQQKTYQREQEKFSKDQIRFKKALESLESRVTAFIVDQAKLLANVQASFSNEQQNVSLRLMRLETAPVPAIGPSQLVEIENVDDVTNSPRIDGLEQRLQFVEEYIGGIGGPSPRFDELQDRIENVETEIEICNSATNVIRSNFSSIFDEIFEPFKVSVEERFKMHTRDLTQTLEALAKLESKIEESQKECPAATFSAPQLALIHNLVRDATEVKQDLSRLRDSVHMEVEQRNAAIEDLKQLVAKKQDIATATQAIDVVKAAVRNLQNQYDNISTDDLHQKMVHWFMQNYPSTPATTLQQFVAIQHEVAQLRKFTDLVTRIPNGAQTLGILAQLGPQLTALVQSPQASENSSEKLARTNEALQAMGDSVAKAHKQNESLAKMVGNLQTSMHTFNSNNASSVKAGSLTTLENSIATLRAELKTGFENELRARKEFETKASNEHDQRVHAEASIKASIKASIQDLTKKLEKEVSQREEAEQDILSVSNKQFRELEAGKMRTLSDQVERLQGALDQIRTDFEKALSDFNDPKNKELFEWLPTLFLHVGQLQWVLEDLNQNLPKGALEIEWFCDWKNKFHTTSPFADSGEAAGKSKGKR